MTRSYHWLLFDADGTLFDYDAASGRWTRKPEYAIVPGALSLDLRTRDVAGGSNDGRHTTVSHLSVKDLDAETTESLNLCAHHASAAEITGISWREIVRQKRAFGFMPY